MLHTTFINSLLQNINPTINSIQYLSFEKFNKQIIQSQQHFARCIYVIFTSKKTVHTYDLLIHSILDTTLWTFNTNTLLTIEPFYVIYPINNYCFAQLAIMIYSSKLDKLIRLSDLINYMNITINTYNNVQTTIKTFPLTRYFYHVPILSPIVKFNNLEERVDAFYNNIFYIDNEHQKKVESISKYILENLKTSNSKHNNICNEKRIINIFPLNNEINIYNKEDLSRFFIKHVPKKALLDKLNELKDYFSSWILLHQV